MSNFIQSAMATPDFVSDSYKGHHIAAFRHSQSWLVYLDRIMQPNRQFACAEDAIKWLRRKVEDNEFDNHLVAFGRRPVRRTGMARAASTLSMAPIPACCSTPTYRTNTARSAAR